MAAQPQQAVAAYTQVAKIDADEDRQRTLEVKALLAVAPPTAGMRMLLIGDSKTGPSWDEAAPLLGAEAAAGDPLSQYLLGRNLWLHGRAEPALRYLNDALDPKPPKPRRADVTWPPSLSIVREAERLRVVVACSEPHFDKSQARDDAQRLRADPGMPAAKKAAITRFAQRCGL